MKTKLFFVRKEIVDINQSPDPNSRVVGQSFSVALYELWIHCAFLNFLLHIAYIYIYTHTHICVTHSLES